MREKILKVLLKDPPKGDLEEFCPEDRLKISCVVVFWKRIELIETLLSCLIEQNMEKKEFEVILVEDRGGSEEGRNLSSRYPQLLINYYAPSEGWSRMGYMRNYGLSKASGEIVLFLDDDTVILDNTFLERLYSTFQKDSSLMAILPRGMASFCLTNPRYSYHDPFFFTNRCLAYRRQCLIELKGFDSSFIGQEDVEFAIRFLVKKYKYIKEPSLVYLHPPFIMNNLTKAAAVGYSFANSKYNFLTKLLLAINGSRWLPKILWPTKKNLYQSKFALGFLIGYLQGILKKTPVSYN